MISTTNFFEKIILVPSSTGGGESSCILSTSSCSWYSKNIGNSSLTLSFSPYIFKAVNYSLTVQKGFYPQTMWVIEGSNDNKNYYLLDEQNREMCTEKYYDGNNYLCSGNKSVESTIKNPRSFLFYRIRTPGERRCDSSVGIHFFPLGNAEFHGILTTLNVTCRKLSETCSIMKLMLSFCIWNI